MKSHLEILGNWALETYRQFLYDARVVNRRTLSYKDKVQFANAALEDAKPFYDAVKSMLDKPEPKALDETLHVK